MSLFSRKLAFLGPTLFLFILSSSAHNVICSPPACGTEMLPLREAVVICPAGSSRMVQTAATMLIEEVEKRTGARWTVQEISPQEHVPCIVLGKSTLQAPAIPTKSPADTVTGDSPAQPLGPEGYELRVQADVHAQKILISGRDDRGVLFGCGRLLREMQMTRESIQLRSDLDIRTSPAYPIRGHQLGYRVQANSWDAWTVAQFDQYVRELTFFGNNSIENIPFQDDRSTPLMKVPRREMNRALSAICAKYGQDYWVWTPADFDLNNATARAAALDQHEELYRDCPELTGVFFPGGDPGDNPPELVLPFLAEVAQRLIPIHPQARIWLSLQGFKPDQVDFVRKYLETEAPTWLAGLVAGPSSPPIAKTRLWLPKQYKLRLYPDITHNKICQYPVPNWDQAYALTLGREAINPRPLQFAAIHNGFAPLSDGFLSYSDGVHDDINNTRSQFIRLGCVSKLSSKDSV